MTSTTEPDLLTMRDISRILSVHRDTPNKWVRQGRIPDDQIVRTLGGQVRVHRAWLDTLMNGGQR